MKQSSPRLRILFSEGSSTSARQALYGLGDKFMIDLVDPSPWCQCRFSSLVHRWIRCPMVAKDPLGYARFVAELVRKHKYDVLFPTHEQVYVFSKFREVFEKDVAMAVPAFDAISRVQSKAGFSRLMGEVGLPTPETRILATRSELSAIDQFPCFLKLIHSTASLGVKKVSSRADLLDSIDQFQQQGAWCEGDEVVIQQPAVGGQCEMSAAFQHGRLVGFACSDVLETGIGGGPALRRSAYHPTVVEHVERLGRHLNWHGLLAMEYFYDPETETPQFIEANPRIGESMNAQTSGVNLCEATARIALGEHVERLPPGKPGVLTHNGFVILIADAYKGANRRQLLHRLWNYWTRQGIYANSESDMTRWRRDKLSLIPATAVILQLLANPRSARQLAHGTVANYSLPYAAARIIDESPSEAILESLVATG